MGIQYGRGFRISWAGSEFKNYVPNFSAGTVHLEDKNHPCMRDVPESFVISKEESYTSNRSPRANVHVLASVDESTYSNPCSPNGRSSGHLD